VDKLGGCGCWNDGGDVPEEAALAAVDAPELAPDAAKVDVSVGSSMVRSHA